MVSSGFLTQEELQQLILAYRQNIEHLRMNNDNLLSMLIVIVNHFGGGPIRVPYAEIESLGKDIPYTIRMAPDEQGENMVISIERTEESGDEPEIPDLSGGIDDDSGEGGGTKFHA